MQGTEPFAPADLDGLTDKQILYVGAHRYVLESATAITLVAGLEPTDGASGAFDKYALRGD